jgi:hypothetical protein
VAAGIGLDPDRSFTYPNLSGCEAADRVGTAITYITAVSGGTHNCRYIMDYSVSESTKPSFGRRAWKKDNPESSTANILSGCAY